MEDPDLEKNVLLFHDEPEEFVTIKFLGWLIILIFFTIFVIWYSQNFLIHRSNPNSYLEWQRINGFRATQN